MRDENGNEWSETDVLRRVRELRVWSILRYSPRRVRYDIPGNTDLAYYVSRVIRHHAREAYLDIRSMGQPITEKQIYETALDEYFCKPEGTIMQVTVARMRLEGHGNHRTPREWDLRDTIAALLLIEETEK